MMVTRALFAVVICLTGCLETAVSPRPGPKTDPDAGLFDARTPLNAPNSGSGYSGYQGSGAAVQPPQRDASTEFEHDLGDEFEEESEEDFDAGTDVE